MLQSESPLGIAMQRAGSVIGKQKAIRALADPEMRARAAWAPAAGETIARHTRATALVRGALIVEVGDYTWQRQLVPLRSAILRNMEKILGEPLVKELDFRPMPARREPQRAETARPQMGHAPDPLLDIIYQQSRRQQSRKKGSA
jgi:hypothetical protein